MHGNSVAKWWLVLSGLALTGVGVLAYMNTEWVGTGPDVIFRMTDALGPVLMGMGVVALILGPCQRSSRDRPRGDLPR